MLSKAEIKKFWNRIDDTEISKPTVAALRLLLVLGLRRVEIATAEWSEIDFDKRVWTIPSEKTKNGRTHELPLPAIAIRLLKELRKHAGRSRYVMPSPTGKEHVTPMSLTRAVSRNLESFGVGQFTPHDLRRTVSTQMRALKVPGEHIERVLNHLPANKLERAYNQHDYFQKSVRH